MQHQLTFKTVRNRRPYFAAPIRRRTWTTRIDFAQTLGTIAVFDAGQTQPLAA